MLNNYGHIVVFNSTKGGFVNRAERFFTRSDYNHTSITIPAVLGVESHISATWKVVTEPISHFMNDESEWYKMYYPVGFSTNQLIEVLSRVYNEFSGETYGFFQLLWFMYRWLMECWPFRMNMKHGSNWFPSGPICSEICWYYIKYLCEMQPKRMQAVEAKLNEWAPDAFSPADCVEMMEEFPGIFFKVNEHWGTV